MPQRTGRLKSLLALSLLVGAASCSSNNFDYTGVSIPLTPYDDLYLHIEKQLERTTPAGPLAERSPTKVASPNGPV